MRDVASALVLRSCADGGRLRVVVERAWRCAGAVALRAMPTFHPSRQRTSAGDPGLGAKCAPKMGHPNGGGWEVGEREDSGGVGTLGGGGLGPMEEKLAPAGFG